MLKFLSVFFVVLNLLSLNVEADNNSGYYYPKLYQNLWPDFCLNHLTQFPLECSEYCTDWNGNFHLAFIKNGSTEAYTDHEVINQLLYCSEWIPANSNKCDFQFCNKCNSSVLRTVCSAYAGSEYDEILIEDDIEFEDKSICRSCRCLDNWQDEDIWEMEDQREAIEDHWSNCRNKAIPYVYFNMESKPFLPFLEQHLEYSQENPDCFCYWPYRSRVACTISDTVYTKILDFFQNSFLKWNFHEFTHLQNATVHGGISSQLIHSFFYSQYRKGLFSLVQFLEPPSRSIGLNGVFSVVDEVRSLFLDLYSQCLNQHPHPKIYYERGMLHFHNGATLDSLADIMSLIDWAKIHNREDLLNSDLYLQEGTFYAELGLYDKAVEALSQAIYKDPNNKTAYLERACAYFELGNFESSVNDYLESGIVPDFNPIDSKQMLSFSKGMTKGILLGGANAGVEFIPSLLSSLHGIGHALWAFAEDPVRVSAALVETSQVCFEFVRTHTAKESISLLVPELKDLIVDWDKLKDEKRGESIGYIIGKYGIDIFAGTVLGKAIHLFRELKRANHILTLEAIAISQRNKTLIAMEATARAQTRKLVLKHANLKIQWDKQGKHVVGHKNFHPIKNKSILEHPNPQKLIEAYSGKGFRVKNVHPGTVGYQEVVDFGEFIGYAVNRHTGDKIATTWGKIHYANDGVHIVPRLPMR